MNWDWSQILVAVLLTIIGSSVISVIIFKLGEKHTRKRLLKALLAELKHNVQIVERNKEEIQAFNSFYANPALKELNTASFSIAREKGILAELPNEVYEVINRAYDIVLRVIKGDFDQPKGERIDMSMYQQLPYGELRKMLYDSTSALKAFIATNKQDAISAERTDDAISRAPTFFYLSFMFLSAQSLFQNSLVKMSLIALAVLSLIYTLILCEYISTNRIDRILPPKIRGWVRDWVIGLESKRLHFSIWPSVFFVGFTWYLVYIIQLDVYHWYFYMFFTVGVVIVICHFKNADILSNLIMKIRGQK